MTSSQGTDRITDQRAKLPLGLSIENMLSTTIASQLSLHKDYACDEDDEASLSKCEHMIQIAHTYFYHREGGKVLA